MADTASEAYELPRQVAAWLEPLDGEPSGPDLEYDPEYMELAQLAAGKPETQFAPAEPPEWPGVRDRAESVFKRTRDLRVAVWWGRARLNLDGFPALPEVLALLNGLLDKLWDDLHPRPDADDGDTFARLAAIGSLSTPDSLLGDVRNAPLSPDRRLGGLRMRELEIALEKLAPRPDEKARTQGQIAGMIADAPEVAQALRTQTEASLAILKQLQITLGQRFGGTGGADLKNLRGMLTGLQSVLPAVPEASSAAEEPADGVVAAPRRGGGVHSVETRQDAVRAIELVCAYLERVEPTNPAQLLLRRAAKVIDMTFLQLVHDLAPDALKEVARIMGVDPATIRDQN